MLNGTFITIEGIEGLGKSTNLEFIANKCRSDGYEVIVSREPGGTIIGEKIRDLILNSQPDDMTNLTELILMFAARAEHISKLIIPALKEGKLVICDRFTDATLAYQGNGRGLKKEIILSLQELIEGELKPDLTILLDAPLEISASRMAGRNWKDRFEKEDLGFFSRVQEGYLNIAKAEPNRVKIINANQSIERVQEDISSLLDKHIKN
ncbi:MAG: dTMP kinase [Pseudomonadota bacterium]|nr:dTMP kinase [Pseudomonadota bacterium]